MKNNHFKEGKLSPSSHNKNKRSIKLIQSSLKKQKKSKIVFEVIKEKQEQVKNCKILKRANTACLPASLSLETFLDTSEPYINLFHYNFRL
jgi:hypothetical protein